MYELKRYNSFTDYWLDFNRRTKEGQSVETFTHIIDRELSIGNQDIYTVVYKSKNVKT